MFIVYHASCHLGPQGVGLIGNASLALLTGAYGASASPQDTHLASTWQCHDMETLSAFLATLWGESTSEILVLCDGNPPVSGGIAQQGPLMQSIDALLWARRNCWNSSPIVSDFRAHWLMWYHLNESPHRNQLLIKHFSMIIKKYTLLIIVISYPFPSSMLVQLNHP